MFKSLPYTASVDLCDAAGFIRSIDAEQAAHLVQTGQATPHGTRTRYKLVRLIGTLDRHTMRVQDGRYHGPEKPSHTWETATNPRGVWELRGFGQHAFATP